MPLNTESRKAKIKKFITFLKENKDDIAVQELDEILEVIAEEHKNFVHKSDLKELIIEMREGFKTMDKRFQDLLHYIDTRFKEQIHYIDKRLEEQKEFSEKRFQAIDKRFEELLHYMDKRFEAVDKRFEELIHNIDKRLEEQKEFSEKRFQAIDKRFEAMDKRFQDLIHYMDKRFEAVDKHFEVIDKRLDEQNKNIKFFQWFLSIFISVLFGITSLFFYYNQAQNEKFYNQIISSLNNLNIQNNKNNR